MVGLKAYKIRSYSEFRSVYNGPTDNSNAFENLSANKPNTSELNSQDTSMPEIPDKKVLSTDYHVYQTFNNCGPASLSMALNYFGINESQADLGNELRPYQNPQGDNDDKSVTLEELADKASDYDLIAYHRPAGDINKLEGFISMGVPVITRTWLKPNDDIGHYRVVKGFDKNRGVLIQDDSLQGKNLEYTFDEFNSLWSKFNYEYLVLVPKSDQKMAGVILGQHLDPKIAWTDASNISKETLEKKPGDATAHFNLSVALYHLGNYKNSIDEFEKVQPELNKRALWYQIEPILSYYKLGKYDEVFTVTDKIINNGNRAFSELYLIRGNIYLEQNKKDLAKQEFEKAVLYNKNFEEAKNALQKVL